MTDQKFGGGSNDVAAHAVRTARNAGSAPPAGAGKRADCVLPESEFRPGGGPKFDPRMSPGAKTAFDNPARPAGRPAPPPMKVR